MDNSSSKDYYKILGVSQNASPEEIRRAYKEAVKKYHPDVAGKGAHEVFLEIREAYEVLSDPYKRKAYDAKRSISSSRQQTNQSIFRGFKGAIKAEIILSKEEAYYGGLFTVSVPFNILCPSCSGLLWLSWRCFCCHGQGSIRRFVPITVKIPPRTIPGTVILQKVRDPMGKELYIEFLCTIQNSF